MIKTQSYPEQQKRWPSKGRHILAHFDDDSIVVYQAYRPATGHYAARHGVFGGDGFSYSRMSWIKPNFLWMMYRSGWGAKENQEVTLGLRLRRTFFDSLLKQAVPSTFVPELYTSQEAWSQAVGRSNVRLQWDPDHGPAGAPLERRAIQLGLRADVLEAFGKHELLEVMDLSAFVAAQRVILETQGMEKISTPVERVYQPADPVIGKRLGLD
jgi:hypothetical protein